MLLSNSIVGVTLGSVNDHFAVCVPGAERDFSLASHRPFEHGVENVALTVVEERLVVGRVVGKGTGLQALETRLFSDVLVTFCIVPQHSSGPRVKYDCKPRVRNKKAKF